MMTFRTEDLASGDVTTWHYVEAMGLLVFKEAGVSWNLYAYNRLGQLTNEMQNGLSIVRSYDAFGRPTGYAIVSGTTGVSGGAGVSPANVGSAVSYAYDTLGRFSSVTSGTNVFSYSYLPGSDLVSGMTANTGHAWERIYEPDRDLIATVHNRYGDRTISRFDYTNDEIGRRIARIDSGEAFAETAFERYAYNDRSEVIGAQRFYGSDITDFSRPVTGRTFGYGYDPIGNRVSSYEDAGGEHLTTEYTANELNQYTAIHNPDAVPLRGDALREATVTVNGNPTERDGGIAAFTPWSYALSSEDVSSHFQQANILAVAHSATGEDVIQSESSSVFVPSAETILEYDDDGNMTFDGRFRYSWNGENRMIRAMEAVAPANRLAATIDYAYDHQGRMVAKDIAGTNTVARTLFWDDYNIIRETDNGIDTYNIWGLDLDGTLQGCGGVGGLLAVSKTNAVHVAFYDANGNISEYSEKNSDISAHYEYSPFGAPVFSTDNSFSHQFSTKPFFPNNFLLEFQFRQFNAAIGRWLSPDPLNESGGINRYLYIGNTPHNFIDLFGMKKKDDPEIDWELPDVTEGSIVVEQVGPSKADVLVQDVGDAEMDLYYMLHGGANNATLLGYTLYSIVSVDCACECNVGTYEQNGKTKKKYRKYMRCIAKWDASIFLRSSLNKGIKWEEKNSYKGSLGHEYKHIKGMIKLIETGLVLPNTGSSYAGTSCESDASGRAIRLRSVLNSIIDQRNENHKDGGTVRRAGNMFDVSDSRNKNRAKLPESAYDEEPNAGENYDPDTIEWSF